MTNFIDKFPANFTWGSATSAYQIEGAVSKDGRGASIWDAFCEQEGATHNGDSGAIACDHYHRYEEDIRLMAAMGVGAYRFSISWSRIMPDGKISSKNDKGIAFYNRVIDCCLEHDITPWVTLYHWDLPQEIEASIGGWLSNETSDLFAEYARLCFECFGDRIKHWITLNEPWVVAVLGYGQGVFAPGHVSNSEPYLAAHNLLIAHAKAVHVYRDDFQSKQEGMIGITNNCDWREPLTDSQEDKDAADIALEFFLAWFADPIYLGDYPESMQRNVGDRMPVFSSQEKAMLLGSSDFFGLNHYTTMYASTQKDPNAKRNVYGNGGLSEDQGVELSVDEQWGKTSMQWAVVPWGCRKLLSWIAARYDNPPIYITENGCAYEDKIVDGVIDDQPRIDFFSSYLDECGNAIELGVDLRGYFAWSMLDNFEWALGYSKRFGLHYVDFETGERTPKNSAIWFSELMRESRKRKHSCKVA